MLKNLILMLGNWCSITVVQDAKQLLIKFLSYPQTYIHSSSITQHLVVGFYFVLPVICVSFTFIILNVSMMVWSLHQENARKPCFAQWLFPRQLWCHHQSDQYNTPAHVCPVAITHQEQKIAMLRTISMTRILVLATSFKVYKSHGMSMVSEPERQIECDDNAGKIQRGT